MRGNRRTHAGKCIPASARISSSDRAHLLATAHRSKAAGRAFEAIVRNPAACKVPTNTFWVKPQRWAMERLPRASARWSAWSIKPRACNVPAKVRVAGGDQAQVQTLAAAQFQIGQFACA